MMRNLGNSAKVAWVLFSHEIDYGVNEAISREVFDIKETCFEKYPGDWTRIDKCLYILKDCSKFEKYKNMNYLTLIPVPFTQKTDITE